MEESIRRYFAAWLENDVRPAREIFAQNVVYSECYGPEYRGLDQVVRWFGEWNARGRVLEWTVKRTIEHGRTIVVEWFFRCEYDGDTDGFDGVTIAEFDGEGRIARLCEYQSKAEHIFPYGE